MKQGMTGKVRDGVIGFTVGDALGVPVEFTERRVIQSNPVQGMRGYGTYNQPAGTWSDDSSMTYALMDSLCEGRFDLEDIARRFVAWYRDAEWTPHGEVFDIGNTTREALRRYERGDTPAVQAGNCGVYDNGNGSLMRILPLAYYYRQAPFRERAAAVEMVSAITHGHVRSRIGCVLYVEIAVELLGGADLCVSMERAAQRAADYYGDEPELHVYERVMSGQLAATAEQEIGSSGYVVHTLEASLWCLQQTNNYREAVLCAVNLGEDTDTTAAVTGGLAGILYGEGGIPEEWVQALARRDDIEALCEQFAAALA